MFCPQFAPIVGGAERQAEKLGKMLCRHGIQVRVLTPRLDSTSPTDEVREQLAVRRFRLNDLTAFTSVRGIGLINAPWIALQVMWQVWREARNFDVVHCHIGSLQSVAAAWGARLRRVPVLCKAAIADDRSDLGEAAKSGLTGRVIAWAGRFAFTRWVATTQAVKDALLRAGVNSQRIVIIPNGVDLPPVRDSARPSRPVRRFLYLGRLSTNTQRDVPGLIAAFDRLAGEIHDVELALVGDGDLLEPTRSLVARCSHAERITVPGQGDAAQWLTWADCFVLPSRREGLSNALLEAMAAGLPCIANDIPPNREVLADGQAGLLVPVGDIDALHNAMTFLTCGNSVAQALAKAATQRVRDRYVIEQVCIDHHALYTRLASQSPRNR